jgi:S-adenosylmethionine hydrolase
LAETRPVIGFLTDFGFDGAAAVCRAVILSICPEANVVDICHTVPKYAVRDGAHILRGALPWFPVGAHLAVVDPGVGTDRRPIVIRTGRGDLLVGPDNGLLLPAADVLGGIAEARMPTDRSFMLPDISSTFHGRDLFAPVTAHLAADPDAFGRVGPLIDPDSLLSLDAAAPVVRDGLIETEVAYVDSFGNLRLGIRGTCLADAFGPGADEAALTLTIGEQTLSAGFARTFGAVALGVALVYVDSSGDLALAESQGNLAARTGAKVGTPVSIGR